MWLALLLAGCGGAPSAELGPYTVALSESGTLEITHEAFGSVLEQVRLHAGTGSRDFEMQFGSFRFPDEPADLRQGDAFGRIRGDRLGLVTFDVVDAQGAPLGDVVLTTAQGALVMDFTAADPAADRTAVSAACDADDHFLGLGGHAMDVDHVGEAFALWTSEPGIGKSESDEPPEDWFFTGTRHATSYPVPFLLRPHRGQGLLADTTARVEVDLCATDPERFSVTTWDRAQRIVLFAAPSALGAVQRLTDHTGRAPLAPPWVFAPWNDAVRGPERVREVAATLREAGAPSSVIWTEDWKGAEETSVGYHLRGEWFVDESLYPDAAGLAQELEDQGFKWFAYFSPFVRSDTTSWDLAVEDDVLIRDDQGEIYRFTGVTFEDESLVDLTTARGQDWAVDWMRGALDLGFDGWMTDYAEWLPPDAVLGSGDSGWLVHNAYPELWQQASSRAIDGADAAYFVRSGWTRTAATAPVVWAGDQRTSFDPDDGFPTIVPMGLGLAASGVPVFTHDVAGYQSVGNPPTTKELWFRWAALGAFTPVLRTHHGAFDTDNWQFDSDEETLAFWARMATEHTRLFPYRYGLAHRAAEQGTPMLLPPAFLFPDQDWGRSDAWMLGDALLVAPVMEAGATTRQVDLPSATRWFDWWTHEPVESGAFPTPLDTIPVFAAAGTTVPMFARAPDTLAQSEDPDLLTLDDVDGERVVLLFGGGGPFTEADGTTYTPTGAPSGSGETTSTLTSGTIDVAGVTLTVDGPRERTYRVIVVD